MKVYTTKALLGFFLMIAIVLCSPRVYASNLDDARAAITEGAEKELQSISLEEYGISCKEFENLYEQMRIHNELPWYVDQYSYNYNIGTNLVNSVSLNYLDPQKYDRDLYEQRLTQILNETVSPGMSQLQIALAIHDYLAIHFSYDESLNKHEAYDLIVNGTAVCEGYAQAYQDLLEAAGVEAILCTSETMDHEWNMIRLGQFWYHVDVTWDDPVSDCRGRVQHDYFLLDDKTISDKDHNHYGWTKTYTADDTSMSTGMFWNDITSQICYESKNISYIRKDDGFDHWIMRRNEQNGELTELGYFDAGSVDIGNGSYHYYHHGLSLWNNRIYYSDMKQIYSMNTDGSGKTVEFSYDAQANNKYLAGFMIGNGAIRITLMDKDHKCTYIDGPVLENVDLAHSHNYYPEEVYENCETGGYILHTCSCGDSYRGEDLDAINHTFDDGFITEDNSIVYTCVVCGKTREETTSAPIILNADPEKEEDDEARWHLIVLAILSILLNQFNTKPRKRVREPYEETLWHFS